MHRHAHTVRAAASALAQHTLTFTLLIALPALAGGGRAQASEASPPTLATAFEQAWQAHPAAASLPSLRAALSASREGAQAWTAQAAAIELRGQTDRAGLNRGQQELEAGLALPLWWPGERRLALKAAEQAESSLDAHNAAARLLLAGQLREAWWAWQRARVESRLADGQVTLARALRDDVSRRVRAGDLSRADGHQAEGALAQALIAQAQAEAQVSQGWQAVHALLGEGPHAFAQQDAPGDAPLGAEPLPASSSEDLASHPLVRELDQQADAARLAAELADARTRANPELLLGTVVGRDQRGEPLQRQLVVGLRLPWGESPAQRVQAARSHAEAAGLIAEAQRRRLQARLALDGARTRWQASQRALEAAQRRADLARETQGFFERSFRLGETDLPTRLRIDREAQEAKRQAALAAIELAAATSAWRQAAGLLPE
jgi:cobalt-zinc-cadmium efflux system outer membrane protein